MTDTFDRLKSALADRYTLERELGRGGMATVYLAEDLKHQRKVAADGFSGSMSGQQSAGMMRYEEIEYSV